MRLICPLPKSPHRSGRIGKAEYQDWYQTVQITARFYKERPVDTHVAIVTCFHVQGDESEQAIYRRALLNSGIAEVAIISVEQGNETLSQLAVIADLKVQYGAEIVIVSTWLHYLRVRWLCRGKRYRHKIAWGIPRPKEVVTDMVLTLAFPLMDLLGLRDRFLSIVSRRRSKGTF